MFILSPTQTYMVSAKFCILKRVSAIFLAKNNNNNEASWSRLTGVVGPYCESQGGEGRCGVWEAVEVIKL